MEKTTNNEPLMFIETKSLNTINLSNQQEYDSRKSEFTKLEASSKDVEELTKKLKSLTDLNIKIKASLILDNYERATGYITIVDGEFIQVDSVRYSISSIKSLKVVKVEI